MTSKTSPLRRTAAASVALALGAFGLTGVVAPALADQSPSSATVITGDSAPQAAFKRVTRRTAPVISPVRQSLTTRSTSYTFSTVIDGKPVRYNPCAPIHWTSSTARGPVGGLQVLQESVARIAAVTGTTWVYDGAAAAEPHSSQLPKVPAAAYPPINIGWTDAARSDVLARADRSSLGVTSNKWFGLQYADGSRKAKTVGSVIALDRTKNLALRGGMSWKAVALHELAHAMGLGHVTDNDQLMDVGLSWTLTDLQAGDLAGLGNVGRAAGCVDVPGL